MSRKITVVLVLVLLVASNASADLQPGPRAMGLSGAFSALGDDAWGAWWNPASILRPARMLLGTEYTSLYPGMDFGTVHYGAVSFLQPVSRYLAIAAGAEFLTTSDLFSEGEANFTVAFRPGMFPLSFGVTGRYLFRRFLDNEFTWYDPLFNIHGQKATGLALDAGFQAELGRVATVGGTVRNLLRPDLGIGEEDAAPMEFSLGAAFYPRFATPVLQVDYSTEDVGGDIDLSVSAGFEKWIGSSSAWGIRAGYSFRASGRTHEASAGFSARTEGSIPLQFDYAASVPLNELSGTYGRHRAGLSFRLDGAPWSVSHSRVPLPPMVDMRTWFTGTDLYEVSLWASRDIRGDTLILAQYDDLPLNSSITLDPGQQVYAYFPAVHTFEVGDIRELTAYLRVESDWVDENGLESRLLRLWTIEDDGTLNRIPIAMINEDDSTYYFEAALDRFGDFLVTCRPAELVMLEPQTVYGDIDSVDILEASLSFRVSKLWMDENRIDPMSIGLSRVRGGVPLDVDVRQLSEDLEYCYYETDPIDLFQFVIVATEREGLPVSAIYFDYNIADIRNDQYDALEQVVRTLTANPGVFVSVEGHADSDGTFSYNDGLSEERAINVAAYLSERLSGVDVEIEASWFGERRPAALNVTEEGRDLNRRVEIVILRRED